MSVKLTSDRRTHSEVETPDSCSNVFGMRLQNQSMHYVILTIHLARKPKLNLYEFVTDSWKLWYNELHECTLFSSKRR